MTLLITDWIASLAAIIGVPLAFYSFIKLIKKDKDRVAQIKSLVNISSKLTEQVEQLAIQASASQYQSTLMFEHNKLIEKQLEIQTEAFANSNTIEAKKLALQKQKQLAEIRPHFSFNGSSNDYLTLVNKGHSAYTMSLEEIDPLGGMMQLERVSNIGRNEQVTVRLQFDTDVPYNQRRYNIRLKFKDIDENEYYQDMKNTGLKIDVENPVLTKVNE
jgi:hypothetical protein